MKPIHPYHNLHRRPFLSPLPTTAPTPKAGKLLRGRAPYSPPFADRYVTSVVVHCACPPADLHLLPDINVSTGGTLSRILSLYATPTGTALVFFNGRHFVDCIATASETPDGTREDYGPSVCAYVHYESGGKAMCHRFRESPSLWAVLSCPWWRTFCSSDDQTRDLLAVYASHHLGSFSTATISDVSRVSVSANDDRPYHDPNSSPMPDPWSLPTR